MIGVLRVFAVCCAAVLLLSCGGTASAPARTVPPAVTVSAPDADTVEPVEVAHDPEARLVLTQARRTLPIRDGARLSIHREPFTLRFELNHYDEAGQRFHAARLTLSAKTEPLALALGPAEQEGEGIHPFGPATGFAADAHGYQSFQLDPSGNHYLTVGSEDPSNDRVLRVRSVTDTRSLVEVTLQRFSLAAGGEEHPIETLPLSALSAAFWVDEDLDEIIEEGELIRFTLEFSGPVPD